jgi:hypothetical protein
MYDGLVDIGYSKRRHWVSIFFVAMICSPSRLFQRHRLTQNRSRLALPDWLLLFLDIGCSA